MSTWFSGLAVSTSRLGQLDQPLGWDPEAFPRPPGETPVCTKMVSTLGTQARWKGLKPRPCSQASWGQIQPALSLLCLFDLGLSFPVCKGGRMIGDPKTEGRI